MPPFNLTDNYSRDGAYGLEKILTNFLS